MLVRQRRFTLQKTLIFCIFEYKDDATAFNGLKKGSFEGKGRY